MQCGCLAGSIGAWQGNFVLGAELRGDVAVVWWAASKGVHEQGWNAKSPVAALR